MHEIVFNCIFHSCCPLNKETRCIMGRKLRVNSPSVISSCLFNTWYIFKSLLPDPWKLGKSSQILMCFLFNGWPFFFVAQECWECYLVYSGHVFPLCCRIVFCNYYHCLSKHLDVSIIWLYWICLLWILVKFSFDLPPPLKI